MADPMQVEVVSADAEIWSGEAVSVVARTVDGDIGILAGHEPVLAVLVPGAVEIVCPNGNRETVVIAVDGGFLSMAQGRISVLSEYAEVGAEVSLQDAEREQQEALIALEEGEGDDETKRRYRRATAQVRAAQVERR